MTILHTPVLGKDYEVQLGEQKEINLPEDLSGQCAYYLNNIKVEHSMRGCDTETEKDRRTVDTVAHELFHAYIHESGVELSEEDEEKLAVWYGVMWRKMNNSILAVLDECGLVDID